LAEIKDVKQELKDDITRVLTSHLQTGCTVIIGTNEEIIKKWINTLYPFILPSQRYLSRNNVSNYYIPDLALQGIKIDNNNREVMMLNDDISKDIIIKTMVPSTIVNVCDPQKIRVRQTYNYLFYHIIRNSYLQKYKSQFYQLKNNEHNNLWNHIDVTNFFSQPESSPFIKRFIKRLFEFPYVLREPFLNNTLHLLIKKSTILLKLIEAYQVETNILTVECTKLRKDMNAMLDNMDPPTFDILLSIAEKVNPGVIIFLRELNFGSSIEFMTF